MTSQHVLSNSQQSETSSDASSSTGTERAGDVPPQQEEPEELPTVTMAATPDDGSCGIGTYTGDLLDSFREAEQRTSDRTDQLTYNQEDRTAGHFALLAVRLLLSGSEVVHVQHEYGLFRRDDSPWPGVMGLVFFPVLFTLNGILGKTIVVTMHSVIKPEPDEAPLRIRMYLAMMHQLIANGSDRIIFLSEQCAERFREDVHLEEDEFNVLPHGVNVSEASDLSTEAAKEKLGFDPDDSVVMIPGFIRPPKGHDIFIEVARELSEHEFLIAGGGRPQGEDLDYAERIREDAPENVTVTGVLDDDEFPTALNAADLAFLPYRVVTQSGTFNWCAAHTIPVVASDEAYFERIEQEWGCVETIDIEDTAEAVTTIREYLESEDRRKALAEKMRRYRRANSFERVADMHDRIYTHERSGEDVELDPAFPQGSEAR